MPKNVLFHFSLIFDLISKNFKGVGFTDHIFRSIFDFILDDLCLQKRTKNESKMETGEHPIICCMQFDLPTDEGYNRRLSVAASQISPLKDQIWHGKDSRW